MMLPFNPFSQLTSKIYGALAAVFLAGLTLQTLRIEGALCRKVDEGERSACFLTGFKQDVADRNVMIAQRTSERDAEIRSHQQTKDNYRQTQREAQLLEAERLARVRAEQEEINNATVSTLRGRLTAARADAERLRRARPSDRTGTASAAPGVPGAAVRDAAGRADEAPGDRRLPLPPAELHWRLVATEQAIQLDELITWTIQQHAIDPNADIAPPQD